MKKLIFTLAAVAALALSAGTASAQAPMPAGPVPAGVPMGGPAYGPMYGGYYGGGYSSGHGHGFGLLSGLFTNHGHHGKNGPQNVNTLPVATGGTLVFPQNPFIRSPRDYFMWDER
jgi:hypothetical protein